MKMRSRRTILAKDRRHSVHERSLRSQQENFSVVKYDLVNFDRSRSTPDIPQIHSLSHATSVHRE